MKSMEGTGTKRALLVVKSPNDLQQRTLVVLGVERGGTSMVAGVIRALGVNLGDKAGRNHEDPKFLSEDREQLKRQISSNNKAHDVWGFKVPKASLMVDFYNENLRNPHYVLVFRNMASIIDSWCARGENDPLETAKHCLQYYGSAIDSLTSTGKPLAIVNYERACENRESFVRELAGFIGVQPSDDIAARATSVITGDGGGYVDIPDYYFHIDAIQPSARLSSPIDVSADGDLSLYARRESKKVSDRFVLLPDGEYFPKEFFVHFNLESERQVIAENGLRVYMDFKGEFFPGHAFRPPVRNGMNVLRIRTNGKVRRIALGPLRQGAVYGLQDVHCFNECDAPVVLESIAEHEPAVIAYIKPRVKKVYRAIRRWLR